MAQPSISVLAVLQHLKSKMGTLIDPVVQDEGLTALQGYVLLLIAKEGALTVGALSEQTGTGQANASTLCKKLEKGGYITRTRSTQDERVVTLALTREGQETLGRIQKKFCRYEQLLEQLPEQVWNDLCRGVAAAEQALDYLNEQTKGEQERC